MNKNIWPFPDRPGVPLNPEKDGWHWLSSWVLSPGWEDRMPWCCKWIAARGAWVEVESNDEGEMMDWGPGRVSDEFNYLGVCYTPAQIANLIKEG